MKPLILISTHTLACALVHGMARSHAERTVPVLVIGEPVPPLETLLVELKQHWKEPVSMFIPKEAPAQWKTPNQPWFSKYQKNPRRRR